MLLKGNSIAFSEQEKSHYKMSKKRVGSKKKNFQKPTSTLQAFSWNESAVKAIAVKNLKAGKVDVKCNRKMYQLTFKGAGTQNIKL